MKNAAALVLCVVLLGSGHAQQAAAAADQSIQSSNLQIADSPALQLIHAAELEVKSNPDKLQAWNDLAQANLRRARETTDPQYLTAADAALARGLKLDPADFQLLKTQVALMLARREYAQARERAIALNRRWRDDVSTYGYIAEADLALGDYDDAEKNTQWMLNLLPNNIPALMLGARLRVVFGDPGGAIEFLNLAYTETSPTELEELAWIANQIAAIEIETGKVDAASARLEGAAQAWPHYAYTLENLARVRLAQHRAADAVALLMEARAIDHDAHVVYELARAEAAAGKADESQADFAEFKKLATDGDARSEEATLDLIAMESESAATKAVALTLAQHEAETRHDVATLDAYAEALYANGRYADADAAERRAMAAGIRSARIFDRAGLIATALHHSDEAAKDFEMAMEANPVSEFAADARKHLGITQAQPAAASAREQAAPKNATPAGESPEPVAVTDEPWAGFAPVPESLLMPRPTETDRAIRTAQATVARNEKDPQSYAALGAAYFQRARETGDVSDYQLAEQALTKSLDLDSSDFAAAPAYATMAEVCMGEHRFTDALTYAQKALSMGSGDVSPFAIVGDAYADMGDYDKARAAYARLTPPEMTLSPRAAYARDSRISYLRFIAGDTQAAIGMMKTAVGEGIEAQIPSENLAWLYFELGEYSAQAGDTAAADTAYVAALRTHPGDYRALAGLAKLRANHGRYAEAIVLYQRAIAVVPMPIFVTELGDLYARAGNAAEAKKQYQLVEYIGQLGRINQVLHNRDLALYYADHDVKLDEALALAHKEFEVRHDIYTWDALAWALYKNGKFAEAAKASDNAIQYGTRDALLYCHAGMIADRMGNKGAAAADLKRALEINPNFHVLYAGVAQQTLARLGAGFGESAVNHGR